MKRSEVDFFLTSSEGYDLEQPRSCIRVKRLGGRVVDDYLLVRIDPPVIEQKYGLGGDDVHELVLATRHEGQSLFPVSEWPLYVHVARPLRDLSRDDIQSIGNQDIEIIGWGEIYEDEEDAKRASGRNGGRNGGRLLKC